MSAAQRTVALWDAIDAAPEDFGPVREFVVTKVPISDVREFCLRWHYSHSGGANLWNFGIWDGPTLVGCVSYNLPTMEVCEGVFGPERWRWVVHMGRLVCAENAPRNTESRLIAASLRLLKGDKPEVRAVVTYADQNEGHVGYVYQATNALYCGLTIPRQVVTDATGARRQGNRVAVALAHSWGWTVKSGLPKHRYIYLLGTKSERREARALLRLPVLPYPKAGHDSRTKEGTK